MFVGVQLRGMCFGVLEWSELRGMCFGVLEWSELNGVHFVPSFGGVRVD